MSVIKRDLIVKALLIAGLLLGFSLPGFASNDKFNNDENYAQVESVRMVFRSDGLWDIHVSVRHNDEGWSHYADAWELVNEENGEVIDERILAHPHDTEQPFTRSLIATSIPEAARNLSVRARCNLHGFGGREITIALPENPQKGSFSIQKDLES